MRTNIIYLVAWEVTDTRWEGYALADDGYALTYTKGETPDQVWFELGQFTERFQQHFPDGYGTILLTQEEAETHSGYQKAYNKNRL